MKLPRELFDEKYPDYYETCLRCGVQACLHSSLSLPGNEKARLGHDRHYDGHAFVRSYDVAFPDSVLATRI